MSTDDATRSAPIAPRSAAMLGPLPECAWAAPQWITEDAYSAAQMMDEKTIGATEAMVQACVELSAALGWPRGISAGPLAWDELLRLVAQMLAERAGNRTAEALTSTRSETLPAADAAPDVLDDLRVAATRKWQGDPDAQQCGLFARAAAEIETLRGALAAAHRMWNKQAAQDAMTDEQTAALTIMLDHFGGDPRTECLRKLVYGPNDKLKGGHDQA